MISIVIPNFNSVELLKKNLPKLIKLLEKSKLAFEIIVSDDSSTDDSLGYLSSLGDLGYLKIVRSSKNTGFAGNVDRGIRSARGEIVFTIKTDALPKSADHFSLMLGHFDNPKVFAVSAALETMERAASAKGFGEPKKEIRGSGEIYFEKGFFLHRRTPTTHTSPTSLSLTSSWSDGSASAIRRDLYLELGGFDSLYNPFYWEDVDLGYRAWKAGYQIDFEPNAILEHSFESGAISRHYSAKQIKLISLRNQFIFVWKNADLKHLLLYFLWEPYHFAVALKNQDWLFFRAYWQAFLRWPGILVVRLKQRNLSRLSDEAVLSKFAASIT